MQHNSNVFGLTESAVEENRKKDGKNVLTRQKPVSLLIRFVSQLKDIMLIILMIAAAIDLIIAVFDFSVEALFEPILIFGIVVLNAALGAFQESKAAESLRALEDLSKSFVRVLRGGSAGSSREIIIDSEDIVRGDIVLLGAGDAIPADCILIESYGFKTIEDIITGESEPVIKKSGDKIFSGTKVVAGKGKAIVKSVGDFTETGRIASMLRAAPPQGTPLQRRLKELSEQLGIVSLIVCFAVFAIGLIGNYVFGIAELDNLTLFIDNNGMQSGGAVEKVGGITRIGDKFASFGWRVREIDGHDMQAIVDEAEGAALAKGVPTCIVAHTVKGKGVPFMEHNNAWHKGVPTKEEYEIAISALKEGCI